MDRSPQNAARAAAVDDADAAEVRTVLDDVVAAVVARADSKEEAPLVARVSSESLADLEKKAPCLRRSVSEAEAP